jgi:hypothetical protein
MAMLRRLFCLGLLLSLALGGGARCCLPQLATAAAMPASGGCHELAGQDQAPEQGTPEPAAEQDAEPGCGSCTHCVTSASLAVPLRLAVPPPPLDVGLSAPLPAGLAAYAPPLRPPISAGSDPIA